MRDNSRYIIKKRTNRESNLNLTYTHHVHHHCYIIFSRFRSPSFQQNEVKALLQLIEKHRYVILNKSTNSAANSAKERVWAKVTAEFCKQGLGPQRTVDVLKTKWENLKRNARKLAKDVMDNDGDFSKDEIKRTIVMICSAENIGETFQHTFNIT